jgi:hypothetical protein
MSPPEIWGPAVWLLFHTLIEHLNENAYHSVSPSLFNMIVRICKFLPCPECSADASKFLSKIKQTDLKSKLEFKNTFYLFHNWVNAKKRKPLFNYTHINNYANYKLIQVINNFISKYHTRGNMNLINESFQRELIIKDFKHWFTSSMKAFVKPLPFKPFEPIPLEPLEPEPLEPLQPILLEPLETISLEPLEPEPLIEPFIEPFEENTIMLIIEEIEEPAIIEPNSSN